MHSNQTQYVSETVGQNDIPASTGTSLLSEDASRTVEPAATATIGAGAGASAAGAGAGAGAAGAGAGAEPELDPRDCVFWRSSITTVADATAAAAAAASNSTQTVSTLSSRAAQVFELETRAAEKLPPRGDAVWRPTQAAAIHARHGVRAVAGAGAGKEDAGPPLGDVVWPVTTPPNHFVFR